MPARSSPTPTPTAPSASNTVPAPSLDRSPAFLPAPASTPAVETHGELATAATPRIIPGPSGTPLPLPALIALIVRTIVITLWAGLLCVVGLRLVLGPVVPGLVEPFAKPVGLSALGGGLFVFMTLVADRWFQRADQRIVFGCEMAMFGCFLLGPVWLVVDLLSSR